MLEHCDVFPGPQFQKQTWNAFSFPSPSTTPPEITFFFFGPHRFFAASPLIIFEETSMTTTVERIRVKIL